ncbi:MAG: response regulator [Helicobacteraceae bacterium]|jgi:DNA-binding NtrC family response regulator|nr:response regulator [Helicobacteraceae bacterium]
MISSKKILFIDDDNFQTETRAQLLTDTHQHVVVIVDSFEEVEILYQKNKFDIVIIDFARDFGLKSLRYIERMDPMQKIITISENEEYSEHKGCDYCVSHYSRRRLKPPFAFLKLLRLVESFELSMCEFKNKF